MKSRSDETKQSAGKKNRLICCKCGGKGHPAWLCPSADDCWDVDEFGTEPSSDGAMTPLRPNSVVKRNDRTRGGKELMAFVDSRAVDRVLPKSVCTEYTRRRLPSRRAVLVLKDQTDHPSNTMGSDAFESRQALEAKYEHHLEVADVCKPLISASRLLERSQACIGRDAEDPVQEWGHHSA